MRRADDCWMPGAPTSPAWGTDIQRVGERLHIETPPEQWAFAAVFPITLTQPIGDEEWYWVRAVLEVEEGAVSIAVVDETLTPLHDRYVHRGGEEETFIPVPPTARHVLIRNIDDNKSRSIVTVRALEMVRQPKEAAAPV